MVILSRMAVESVSLTKQEGEPYLLIGNKLYFKYYKKVKRGAEETSYGYVDISISRRSFTPCLESTVPRIPERKTVDVSWQMIAFGFWMIRMSAKGPYYHVPVGQYQKGISQLTLSDFAHVVDRYQCDDHYQWEDEQFHSWRIPQELLDEAKQNAQKTKCEVEAKLNKNFVPTRVLDEELTAQVLGIFNFDGDKKGLVTALKSSWDVEIKDSDVKIDKFFTGRILLPKTIEELIPEPGRSTNR